jgi:hypothetical protein
LELSERLPKSSVMIPDGKGAHVTLDRVEANIGRRHVRGAWAKVAKAIKAALAAQPLGRESGTSPGKLKEAEQDLDDIISGRRISTTVTTASPTGVMSPGFSGEIPGRRPVFPDEGRVSPYTGSLPS